MQGRGFRIVPKVVALSSRPDLGQPACSSTADGGLGLRCCTERFGARTAAVLQDIALSPTVPEAQLPMLLLLFMAFGFRA